MVDLSALYGGIASGVGTLVSSALSAREAEKNRKWQEMFYQNRHQWEVADLKAAGLNPILSAMNGSAGVPGGATGQVGDLGAAVSKGVSSAASSKLAKVAESKADSEIGVNNATASKLESESRANDQYTREGAYREISMIADVALKNATTATERKRIDVMTTEVQRNLANVGYINKQIDVLEEEKKKLKEEIDYIRIQGNESSTRQRLNNAEAALAAAESKYKGLLGKKAMAETEYTKAYKKFIDETTIPIHRQNDWDREHPGQYGFRQWSGSVSPFLNGAGSLIGAGARMFK